MPRRGPPFCVLAALLCGAVGSKAGWMFEGTDSDPDLDNDLIREIADKLEAWKEKEKTKFDADGEKRAKVDTALRTLRDYSAAALKQAAGSEAAAGVRRLIEDLAESADSSETFGPAVKKMAVVKKKWIVAGASVKDKWKKAGGWKGFRRNAEKIRRGAAFTFTDSADDPAFLAATVGGAAVLVGPRYAHHVLRVLPPVIGGLLAWDHAASAETLINGIVAHPATQAALSWLGSAEQDAEEEHREEEGAGARGHDDHHIDLMRPVHRVLFAVVAGLLTAWFLQEGFYLAVFAAAVWLVDQLPLPIGRGGRAALGVLLAVPAFFVAWVARAVGVQVARALSWALVPFAGAALVTLGLNHWTHMPHEEGEEDVGMCVYNARELHGVPLLPQWPPLTCQPAAWMLLVALWGLGVAFALIRGQGDAPDAPPRRGPSVSRAR